MGLTLALLMAPSFAQAEEADPNPIDVALELAGVSRERLGPDPLRLMSSPRSEGQAPLLRALLASPLSAGYRVGMVERRFHARADSIHRLFLQTCTLAGADIARGYLGNPLAPIDARLLAAEDALAESLAMLEVVTGEPFDWRSTLPDRDALPNPLRHEIARVIATITNAERFRRRAFRNVDIPADPMLLLGQVFGRPLDLDEAQDYRLAVRDVEYEALYAGMLDLVLAMEDFEDALLAMEEFPPVKWRVETPLGVIILDTHDEPTHHAEGDPLLIIDLGGDDLYELGSLEKPLRMGISIIYDHAGNDEVVTLPGRGASAIFGYGIHWDREGDDVYRGSDLAQASAVFGAALLVDREGNDEYRAVRGSQSFALGGAALLVDFAGDDVYTAITNSQGSAGPYGAAVLFDLEGNDQYRLTGEGRIVSRSAQSPEHNSSMGQGCGYGVRADLGDGRSLPGGVGMLFDGAGDDIYEAEVFAQGAGFLEGLGALVDGGGNDQFSAVWYGMASAAHRAAGVLISRGTGNDRYEASRYTSIGAAHDLSVAFFIDEGGDDVYTVENLGIGGANDNGTAIFVDAGGDDVYTVRDRSCHALGRAKVTLWGTWRESATGLGLFFDLGGKDEYKVGSDLPANDALLRWPPRHPELDLPSDVGIFLDGDYPNPFHTIARTTSDGEDERMLNDARRERRRYRAAIKP